MADKEVRLIDANRFKETLARLVCVSANNKTFERITNQTLHDVVPKLIDDEPTIEAQPVKHGLWMDNPNHSQLYSYICSNCRSSCDWTYRYCPNCGSKNRMDGDSE